MRRQNNKKRTIEPDLKYGTVAISKFINYVMKAGKKEIARKIVYSALDISGKELKREPLDVFDLVIKNISPTQEVKSKRVGGANYQVPVDVRPDRKLVLAMRWLLTAAKSKKGKPMAEKLAEEMISATKNEGIAIKKRNDMYRMAESNKAFASFRR
ncbi:30S ribosomal protein S7 [Candidatus Azambacteria bacterium]|nr:30S ribosomal protein S7 [Candidatus Azambacteria bacterium]